MNFLGTAETLLLQRWWSYSPRNPSWIEVAYHSFNQFEGAVWIIMAALVLRRFARFRHSPIELIYATAFFTFGLTDLVESYVLTSWLIWAKAANLGILFTLRRRVLSRYYPESHLY